MSAITIAIEGSDGAGKATQTELLVQHLEQNHNKVGRVSFPRYNTTSAGTLLFEFLKSNKAAEYDFVNANPKLASRIYAQDRFESLAYLNDLIAQNDFVVFDRYVESNLLHQGGKLKTNDEMLAFANWLFGLEYGELVLPRPDIIVYLDLPYSFSYERAFKRAREKGEELDAVESNMDYVRRGSEAGRIYAEMFGWDVVKCVTFPEPHFAYELKPEEIHMKIREIIQKQ